MVLFIALTRLDDGVKGWATKFVADAGGQLSIDELVVHPLGLSVEFRGLRLALRREGAPDLVISATSGRLRISPWALWGLPVGRVHLSELELSGATVESSRAFWRAAGRARRERRPLDLRFGHLLVQQGRFHHDEVEVPLEIDVENVELQGRWDPTRAALRGSASATVEIVREPFVEPLRLDVSAAFLLGLHDVQVDAFEARGSGVSFEGEGSVSWLEGLVLAARAESRVDLAVLATRLRPAFRSMSGQLGGDVFLEIGPEPWIVRGNLRAERPVFDELGATWASAALELASGRLGLSRVRAAAWQGEVRGEVNLSWGDGPVRYRADLDATDLAGEPVLRALRLRLPIATTVDARGHLEGLVSDRTTLEVQASFVASEAPAGPRGDVPMTGRGEVLIEAGRLSVRAGGLRAPGATVDLEVDAVIGPPRPQGVVAIRATTHDATATQAGVLRILDGLEVVRLPWLREPLRGQGEIAAKIGFGAGVDLSVEAALTDGSWAERPFDRLRGTVAVTGRQVEVRALEWLGGAEQVRGSFAFAVDPLRFSHVDLSLARMDLPWLFRVTGNERLLEFAPDGRLSGQLRLEPGVSGPVGEGRLVVDGGRWFGESLDRIDAGVEVGGGEVRLTGVELLAPGVHAPGRATWWPGRERLEVTVSAGVVELATLERLTTLRTPLEGRLDVDGELVVLGGVLDGSFHFRSETARVATWPLGEVRGRVDLAADSASLELVSSEGESWRLTVDSDFEAEPNWEARLTLLDAAFEVHSGATAARGQSWLSGELRAVGRGAAFRSLEGSIDSIELQLGGRVIETDAPLPLRLEGGVLHAGPTRLTGAGTDLEVALSYHLEADSIDLVCRGEVDLGLLTSAYPDWRVTGVATVDLRAEGPRDAPRFTGSVQTADSRVRWSGFPQGLQQVAAVIRFEGGRANVESARARFGNGEVRASGSADLGLGGLSGYRIELEGSNVHVGWPEDFRGIYEARLVVAGEAGRGSIAGQVVLIRGLYTRELSLAGLLGEDREYASEESDALPDAIDLDVTVVADSNLWIRNELAEIESRLDLHVGGTLRRPEVTGRVAGIEGGKIHFRDVQYQVLDAAVDLLDVDRFNPRLTLRAQTSVREYVVQLRVEGTLDRFEYDLTSDPPLSTQDIIALLTTGATLDPRQSPGIARDVATSYFAEGLTQPVERQLQRSLGLDRVRIDPLLVQGEAGDPTARLTLGKRVGQDFFVVYSREVGENERQLYQVQWEATRKFRVQGERDTQGGIGGSVQYSDRFWWYKVAPMGAVVGAAPPAGPPVSGLRLEGLPAAERDRLLPRVGFAKGDVFSRSRVYDGVEALRRYFVRAGRIESRIDAEFTEGPDGVEVLYRVEPGPKIEVSFEGVGRRDVRRLQEILRELWIDSAFSEDLHEDARARVRDYFQSRGYYTVDVATEVQSLPSGRRLILKVDRGLIVRVEDVFIEGASEVGEERIRRQMLTRSGSLWNRRELVPEILREDLVAIRNLYRDLGYLGVRTDPPAVRLSARGDAAEVTVRIDEGEVHRISEVRFPPELPFAEADLRKWVSPLAAGEVFSTGGLNVALTNLRSRLDEQGYIEARIRGNWGRRGDQVTVRFDVEPGALKRVGEVQIIPPRLTQQKVIRREIDLRPGDPISRERLLRSQQRLHALGIFRSVHLDYEPIEGTDPSLQRLVVLVDDGPPFSTALGAGYDTEAGPRINFALSHDNVGGYRRLLGFQGRFSGIERRLQVVAREPRLFASKVPLLLNVSWEELEETGYDLERRSTGVRLDRRWSEAWSAFLRYGYQRVDLTNVEDPLAAVEDKLENLRLGDLGLTVQRDGRDDVVLPTRGSLFSLSARVFAQPLLSDDDFVKLGGSFSTITPLKNELALVSSVRLGAAVPWGATQRVPLSERYFAGGDSTLRGFGRDEVGPAEQGLPSGGQALVLLNEELRVPLWRRLKGVAFYDAGNVYPEVSDVDLGDIRHVLGLGLRLETPIGPLRIEYGRKLDREPGESRGEIFLAIGNAF